MNQPLIEGEHNKNECAIDKFKQVNNNNVIRYIITTS